MRRLRRADPAAAATAEALKFFAWAYAKGDKMAEELDYVPMPDKVVNDVQKMWSTEIKEGLLAHHLAGAQLAQHPVLPMGRQDVDNKPPLGEEQRDVGAPRSVCSE